MNVVALVKRFKTPRVKCWAVNFHDLASKGSDIIMHQLTSIYNSAFKDS